MDNFCVMHILILAFLTLVAGGVSVFCLISYYNDTKLFAGMQIKQLKWAFRSGGAIIIFCSLLSWWIYSANQPLSVRVSTFHEIKEVVFPDGTKVQMYSCDGVQHDLTERFGKIVDENWVIHRIVYNTVYAGVCWPANHGRNQFNLERRDVIDSSEFAEKPLRDDYAGQRR